MPRTTTTAEWLVASMNGRMKPKRARSNGWRRKHSVRSCSLGYPTYRNDLNPVASLIECATVKWPAELGVAFEQTKLLTNLSRVSQRIAEALRSFFPQNRAPSEIAPTLSLGTHYSLPILRGLGAAFAKLATCARRNRRSSHSRMAKRTPRNASLRF